MVAYVLWEDVVAGAKKGVAPGATLVGMGVVTDIGAFENFAAIKLVVEASGAVKNMTMLEAIDFTKATTKASQIGYKPPGQ